MSGMYPAKTLEELGCSYTLVADSLSMVNAAEGGPLLCMKVGRAAVLFKLTPQTITGLRVELAKL
jgi:hypothetical protein